MAGDHSIADAGGPETALAATCYTDPAMFEQEKARIFFRTWQYAGQLSQVAEPGAYFTFDICGQGLFVIRGLGATRGLSPERAYMLCSVCADMRISEVVGIPNWVVSCYLPRIVFD